MEVNIGLFTIDRAMKNADYRLNDLNTMRLTLVTSGEYPCGDYAGKIVSLNW
jgi:hypothetical protein